MAHSGTVTLYGMCSKLPFQRARGHTLAAEIFSRHSTWELEVQLRMNCHERNAPAVETGRTGYEVRPVLSSPPDGAFVVYDVMAWERASRGGSQEN